MKALVRARAKLTVEWLKRFIREPVFSIPDFYVGLMFVACAIAADSGRGHPWAFVPIAVFWILARLWARP